MLVTVSKLKIGSVIHLHPITLKAEVSLSFVPEQTVAWPQSATCMRLCRQFILCVEFCARRLHCVRTRDQGKAGICPTELVTRLSMATACFSSLVFLFYITTGLFDLYRTLLLQKPGNLHSIPHHLLIIFFLQCCQLSLFSCELCDTQYLS